MRNNIILGIILSIGTTIMVMLPRVAFARENDYFDIIAINTFVMLIATWFLNLALIDNRSLCRLIPNRWIRSVVIIVSAASIVFLLLEGFDIFINKPQIWESFIKIERRLRRLSFARVLLWSIIYHWILFSQRAIEAQKNAELEASRANQLALEAKMTSLREQLSPHFMFNSLNTLSSMTHDEVVQNFIDKLANVYRYLLTHKEQRIVSVKSELDFVEAYWHILKERFEEAIELHVSFLSDTSLLQIPPMTLQILIENAIKHNKTTKQNPLIITIREEGGYIVVSNKSQPKIKRLESFSVGLCNLSERYKLLFDKEIEITHGDEFIVKLPIMMR